MKEYEERTVDDDFVVQYWKDDRKMKSKKYKLLIKNHENQNMKVTCICGKCKPEVRIDESVKEEFKELMGWDETEFKKRTIEVED